MGPDRSRRRRGGRAVARTRGRTSRKEPGGFPIRPRGGPAPAIGMATRRAETRATGLRSWPARRRDEGPAIARFPRLSLRRGPLDRRRDGKLIQRQQTWGVPGRRVRRLLAWERSRKPGEKLSGKRDRKLGGTLGGTLRRKPVWKSATGCASYGDGGRGGGQRGRCRGEPGRRLRRRRRGWGLEQRGGRRLRGLRRWRARIVAAADASATAAAGVALRNAGCADAAGVRRRRSLWCGHSS